MKKHMIISFVLIAILIIVPTFAYAYGAPLGSYITSTIIPGVTCTGGTPMVLRSVKGQSGPFLSKSRPVSAGRWLLGSYTLIKDVTSCKLGDDPYPITVVNPAFGISR